MVFQDPMTSLNPVLTIEEQLVETIRAHKAVTTQAAVRGCRAPHQGRDSPSRESTSEATRTSYPEACVSA